MCEYRNVLITGGAGYVGSLLTERLLAKGYHVTVLERFSFGIEPVKEFTYHPDYKIHFGDVRNSGDIKESLKDAEAVIHLAAIVGDPACAVQADLAVEVNYKSTVRMATLAKEAGIRKFIFASTCSVYGANVDKTLKETDELNPVSLYGETKMEAEKELLRMTDDEFRPTLLRFGTLHGLSRRMRFDLVVNYLTQKFLLEKEGKIFGGEQWRPFVHVRDIAKALSLVLEAPVTKVGGEIYNVGATRENYQMRDIGKLFEKHFRDADVQYIEEVKDKRTYRVSFEKIERELGFSNDFTVEDGIREIRGEIEAGRIKDPTDKRYRNYNP